MNRIIPISIPLPNSLYKSPPRTPSLEIPNSSVHRNSEILPPRNPNFYPQINMVASPAIFSSILNVPGSKISNPDVGFPRIRFLVRKKQFPINPAPIGDCSAPSSSGACNSAAISNSLTLDQDSINDEEVKRAESKIGSKVRVKGPLKVYHVPKVPELELVGMVGVLKQYVGVYKGKRISANLPYKVEFEAEGVSGRDGKPVKFVAHLREDELEFLD